MKKRLIISELFLFICAFIILFCACQSGAEQTNESNESSKIAEKSTPVPEQTSKTDTTVSSADASAKEVSTGNTIELDPSLEVLRTAKGNIILTKKEIESNTQITQIEFKDMNTDIKCEVKCTEIMGERYFFSADWDDPDENEVHCSIFDTKNKPYFFVQTFQPAFGTIFIVDKRTFGVSKLIPDEMNGISREESLNEIKDDMMENPDAYEWATNWIKYEFFDDENDRLFFFAPFLKGENPYPMWSIDVKSKEVKFVTDDLTNYYMPSYMGNYNKYAMVDEENLVVVMDEILNINLNTSKVSTVKVLPGACNLLDYSYPYAVFKTSNWSIVKYNFETKKCDEFTIPNTELNISSALLSKDGEYIACELVPRDGGIMVIDTKSNKKRVFLKGKLLREYFWTEDGSLIAIIDEPMQGNNENGFYGEYKHLSYRLLL